MASEQKIADVIGGFPITIPHCKGCGETLTVENAWMTDGCPCNSPLGVNSLNETRWRLLMDLQQRQSRKLERIKEAIWPGLPKWQPTAEQPQQDFYEAVAEGLRDLLPLEQQNEKLRAENERLRDVWSVADQTLRCNHCGWVDWPEADGTIKPHSDECPIGYLTNKLAAAEKRVEELEEVLRHADGFLKNQGYSEHDPLVRGMIIEALTPSQGGETPLA